MENFIYSSLLAIYFTISGIVMKVAKTMHWYSIVIQTRTSQCDNSWFYYPSRLGRCFYCDWLLFSLFQMICEPAFITEHWKKLLLTVALAKPCTENFICSSLLAIFFTISGSIMKVAKTMCWYFMAVWVLWGQVSIYL
jgi:hypothetical protein